MIKLTDEQLQFAAREYCARLGKNPDEMILVSHPEGFATVLRSSRWAIIADELKDRILRQGCIDAALVSEETHDGTGT